jgi:hypothetical protein
MYSIVNTLLNRTFSKGVLHSEKFYSSSRSRKKNRVAHFFASQIDFEKTEKKKVPEIELGGLEKNVLTYDYPFIAGTLKIGDERTEFFHDTKNFNIGKLKTFK